MAMEIVSGLHSCVLDIKGENLFWLLSLKKSHIVSFVVLKQFMNEQGTSISI